jgi:transposase InsO family protein
LDRLIIIEQVKLRQIGQEEAGMLMGISSRQVRRLLRRVIAAGAEGIKSGHKGGNRAFSPDFRQKVMAAVREKYPDFGPTFASEKLAEAEGLQVNRETLRQWMVEEGLRSSHARKKPPKIHQSRQRRPCFGELVQIDGSHHDWFEGRGPKCCLLVYIDDATGRILALHFSKGETTHSYMEATRQHLAAHGRPIAYYSDKDSVFITTRSDDGHYQDTQFQRALRELEIELICAETPQAKGRVERANQTLQDRLIKEMRLRGIDGIEAANAFAQEFIAVFNEKFGRQAANPQDRHRPVRQNPEELRRILCVRHQRKVTKNLEFSLQGKVCQIVTATAGYRLQQKTLTICEYADGKMEVLNDNVPLAYRLLTTAPRTRTANAKGINVLVDELAA